MRKKASVDPDTERAPLVKEMGVWVYRSGCSSRWSIVELIDQFREERIRELMECESDCYDSGSDSRR